MGRRKGSLCHRKNERSSYHMKRARDRKDARVQVLEASHDMELNKRDTTSASDSCIGFDVMPIRKSIRVLSLFDGISTLLYALDSMNLHVDAYFSSEIDENALAVQMFRYGNRITRLGCVKTVTEEVLHSLGDIDLICGGSPCSDLSLVNWRRKGLKDPSSTGSLFYEFVRIKNYLADKAAAGERKLYWLFENTSHMEVLNKKEISRALGCEPVLIDALTFLSATRKRNFWGNVTSMPRKTTRTIERETMADILSPGRFPNVPHVPTLTTSSASQRCGKGQVLPVLDVNGQEQPLYITEKERLFGLPASYTDGPNLSMTDRRKLLDKAFVVPVIMELLAPLKEIFWVRETP